MLTEHSIKESKDTESGNSRAPEGNISFLWVGKVGWLLKIPVRVQCTVNNINEYLKTPTAEKISFKNHLIHI